MGDSRAAMTHRRLWVRGLPAVIVVLAAVVGPWLAPHGVDDGVGAPFAAPSSAAWLGSDRLGHDVFSQLLRGGWGLILLAAFIAAVVTGLASVLGAVVALWPRWGAVIERCADLLILLPVVLALLLVVMSWPRWGTVGVVTVGIVFGVPYCARVFAAAATGIAATGYIEAARLSGESAGYVIFREMLPNMRELLLTQLGLRFVAGMYIVATAAFLRLPTALGEANWAVMVRDNASGILLNPWAVLAPSLAIGVVAVSVNLLAAALGTVARLPQSIGGA
ncbi:ABC transporter permease subunit [Nocardia sp. CDC159]|uniref:ABC transporter permease subunit n=1 Tax=Nocardia pulmonis TaxID=2951408 RepID=A0A9X2J1M0_9NOCA|nr:MULTISPECIES: ABC transporter permease subunit [Nocardia]MCM6777161.1 ABC transporter permease subunit [Nocardia pulmonis]MCM6790046.1 ABC transporter permease subunit [Nocardia sp. CDC159]